MLADLHEILKDEKGFFYLYKYKNKDIKIRVEKGLCRNCGREMFSHTMKKNNKETYCCLKCKPNNTVGLELGRAWNKGLKNHLSYDVIKKMSLSHVGKRSGNWKGCKRGELKRLRELIEYKNWRNAVFERDNFTCQQCGKRGVFLNAHHIKSFKNFPELRTELSNGITLCVHCHYEMHKKGEAA